MKHIIFHNKAFEIEGFHIPEFELTKGKLVRIYIPNFGTDQLPLNFDLTIALIKRFQIQKTDFPWAKNYSQSKFMEFISPLTVKRYLLKKMKINLQTANQIASDVGVKLNDKFEYLGFKHRKALIVRAAFEKSNCILIDYYAISALGVEFLEKIVDSEINKGKSAIVFDLLQYAAENEPYENIEPIKIEVPSLYN